MKRNDQKTVVCQICKQQKRIGDAVSGEFVRHSIAELIKKEYPHWSSSGFICLADLNRFRTEYVEDVLEEDKGELSKLEKDVLRSLKRQDVLAKDINIQFEHGLTIGEKLADKLAKFGGSWIFISAFAVVIALWIIVNSFVIIQRPFDPYPYILLNLVLSCLAALQAPVIMMSQRRQETRDRLRAENDYRVNLKAELEIRHLHNKMDHLLMNQWQKLVEIQQIQMELMEELAGKSSHKRAE